MAHDSTAHVVSLHRAGAASRWGRVPGFGHGELAEPHAGITERGAGSSIASAIHCTFRP
ncbi:MAG TPA: hypothetical protein VMJ10_36605 [Kofleriaceae bacterium]|nr:hypothetical protein [Kofleriaceae bacterium]